jgi:hypothetical protein
LYKSLHHFEKETEGEGVENPSDDRACKEHPRGGQGVPMSRAMKALTAPQSQKSERTSQVEGAARAEPTAKMLEEKRGRGESNKA